MGMVSKEFLMYWSIFLSKLSIRLITKEDCFDVLSWRNDNTTRKMSLKKSIISRKEHIKWFDEMLSSCDQQGFIGEFSGSKIGVVFFKNKVTKSLVSINLNPNFRGFKLSASLLCTALKKFSNSSNNIKYFEAEIKKTNYASINIFEKNGFEIHNLKNGIATYMLAIK